MATAAISKTSFVWDYFEIIPGTDFARCQNCKAKLNMGTSHSTKGLWTHLKSYHKKDFDSADKRKKEAKNNAAVIAQKKSNIYVLSTGDSAASSSSQPVFASQLSTSSSTTSAVQPKISDIYDPIDKYKPANPKQKELTYLLAEWLADGLLPFNTVNNSRFRVFLEAAHPKYVLPKDKFFRDIVTGDIFERVKLKILDIIKTQVSVFTATTDMWSSETRQSYISLTVHFIDESWCRKMAVLTCQPFFVYHTGANIAAVLKETLIEWGIPEKLHMFLRDSGANVIAAMRCAPFESVPCFLHTLQLVVNSGLLSQRSISDMMVRLQNCCKLFRNSSKAKEKLHAAQRQMSLPVHVLLLGEKTRWSSYAKSLGRALEQKLAICDVSSEMNLEQNQILNDNDWKLIEQTKALLEPFVDATTFGEREDACISEVIPTILKIYRQLDRLDPKGAYTMQEELKLQLKKYFCGEGGDQRHQSAFASVEQNELYTTETLLDPRFKNKFFMDKNAAETAQGHLVDRVAEILKRERETIIAGEPLQKRPKITGFFADLAEELVSDDPEAVLLSPTVGYDNDEAIKNIAENIVAAYMKESLIDTDTDPLAFWRMKITEMPVLAKMAKKYLSAPMGTVASEREFKVASDITGGDHITGGDRIRLLPENAEKLLFLKYNLRAVGYNSWRLPIEAPEEMEASQNIIETEDFVEELD